MGYLAAKDLGTTNVNVDTNNLFVGINTSPDGIANPTNAFGNTVDLRSFSFSYGTGKNIDDSANVAGNITRIATGSKKPIPFTLEAKFNRKPANLSASQIVAINSNSIRNISYILKWCRSSNVIMLFWMPNSDVVSSGLSYKQEKDFFTSQLKNIYDALWDRNLGSTTNGYGVDTYGTIHFDTGYAISGLTGNYQPCAIPVTLGPDFTIKEDASTKIVTVSIPGFVLENEGRR